MASEYDKPALDCSDSMPVVISAVSCSYDMKDPCCVLSVTCFSASLSLFFFYFSEWQQQLSYLRLILWFNFFLLINSQRCRVIIVHVWWFFFFLFFFSQCWTHDQNEDRAVGAGRFAPSWPSPQLVCPMSWVLQWPLVQKKQWHLLWHFGFFNYVFSFYSFDVHPSVERSYLYKPWYIFKTWLRTLKVLYIFIICSRYRLLWTWNWWFPGFCGNRPRDSPDAHEIFNFLSFFFFFNSSRHSPMSVPFYPCFFHCNDWT